MSSLAESERELSLVQRLWIYQRERFPLGRTSLLLLVFSAASISLSAHLAGRALPSVWTFVAIWLAVVLVFFQLRAADEYKDFDEDARYRTERAVPRGLVSLKLVLWLAVGAALVIVALTLSIAPKLLVPLCLLWLWLGLMTAEFFVPAWLKARPFVYLVSHMAIMAFIDFYVTAAEWLPHAPLPPAGIWIFVVLSCVNGCVLEFGRKIWAPQNERTGVETYSGLLGPCRAAQIWIGLCVLAWALLSFIGFLAGGSWITLILGALALIAVGIVGLQFMRSSTPQLQGRLDTAAGLWVLACYAIAGFSPYLGQLLP
jgi:4-hydroxybenzoate polyprenyltransferase